MYLKKVTYLGGQIGNQAWKLGRHLVKTSRISTPTRRKVEICFGSVLFSLDEWILCSDNQNLQSTCPMDKWSEKNVFFPGESECELDMKKSRSTSHHSSCYRKVQKSTLTSCDKFLPSDWNKEGNFTCRTREKLWKQQLIDVLYYCPRRDFAFWAKSRGGTLVTRAYIKESTYSWNIQSYSNIEIISICLNRGREESVGSDDVSIVCARKYEMVRMT